MDDQIELLTRSRNVRHVLDNLPVKHSRAAQKVQDTITNEPEETQTPGESPFFQAFLTGLSWATYSLAIVATIFLTWAASRAFG